MIKKHKIRELLINFMVNNNMKDKIKLLQVKFSLHYTVADQETQKIQELGQIFITLNFHEGQIKIKETALDLSEASFLEKEKDLQQKIQELERRSEVVIAEGKIEFKKGKNKFVEMEKENLNLQYRRGRRSVAAIVRHGFMAMGKERFSPRYLQREMNASQSRREDECVDGGQMR
ncbi:hypothetical protein LXL04_030287 [Taraxacum kok-saghyz]